MTQLKLCEHGQLAGACLDCLEGPPDERPQWVKVGVSFRAVHDSKSDPCAGCGEPIHKGQAITRFDRTNETESVYVHTGCHP